MNDYKSYKRNGSLKKKRKEVTKKIRSKSNIETIYFQFYFSYTVFLMFIMNHFRVKYANLLIQEGKNRYLCQIILQATDKLVSLLVICHLVSEGCPTKQHLRSRLYGGKALVYCPVSGVLFKENANGISAIFGPCRGRSVVDFDVVAPSSGGNTDGGKQFVALDWTRLIAFHIALIPLGKVWIQLFSLQLWVNSRTDWSSALVRQLV